MTALAYVIIGLLLAVPFIHEACHRGIHRGRQIERYGRTHIISGDEL